MTTSTQLLLALILLVGLWRNLPVWVLQYWMDITFKFHFGSAAIWLVETRWLLSSQNILNLFLGLLWDHVSLLIFLVVHSHTLEASRNRTIFTIINPLKYFLCFPLRRVRSNLREGGSLPIDSLVDTCLLMMVGS